MNKPSKEEYKQMKLDMNDKSIPKEMRDIFKGVVDKFKKDFEEVGGETEKEVKKVEKGVKKVVKKAISSTKKALTKADILKKVGKTEKECEDILDQYKSLRSKATTRKKAETKAKDDNKKRVTKLKAEDKVIKGTTEKKATSTLETTAKKVEDKVEKEIKKIEDDTAKKVEAEIKPIIAKKVAKDNSKTATEKKAEVKKIVEVKVKEAVKKEVKKEGKKIVAKLEVDTKDIITSITTALGNHDKDLQKEFLIKLRSDIDKLLKEFMYGGLTDGASSVQNITQSQMSSSSVNFAEGGTINSFTAKGIDDEKFLYNLVEQKNSDDSGKNYVIRVESKDRQPSIMAQFSDKEKALEYLQTFKSRFPKEKIVYAEGGMTDRGYNGWTNYATWRINLEMVDGVEWDEYNDGEPITKDLLESYVEEGLENSPELAISYANAFLNDVNYYEIAKHINEDYSLSDDEEFAKGGSMASGGEIIDTFTSIQGSKVMPNNPFTIEKENEFYVIKNSKGEVLAKDTTKDGIMNDKGMFLNLYAKGGKLWLDTGKKGGTKGVKKSNRGSFRAKADARGLTSKQLAQKVIANPKRYKGIKESSAHLVNNMVKRHGGGIMNADNQFTKKANQRGVSVEAFMQRVLSNPSKYDATTIKQARTLKNNS
tara:strand:+ start:7320 stop:9272 length:1953 start_codon:yes stop_codon:yes gene_type:complete